MKKARGFSKVGVIVGIAAVALIGVATWLVIDGNNKATNFDNYDFYSVIPYIYLNMQIFSARAVRQ